MKKRKNWDEDLALSMLHDWIDEGKWEGTTHFRRHNTSLYEYIYRTLGMEKAFQQLGINYAAFKRSKGRNRIKRDKGRVLQELKKLVEADQWRGIRHLQENHSLLYRELSRIGFKRAFERIGLDYRDYRSTIWNEDDFLDELRTIIDEGEWRGTFHLKQSNSRLYNAIMRDIGFTKAFHEIGLDYEDYKSSS